MEVMNLGHQPVPMVLSIARMPDIIHYCCPPQGLMMEYAIVVMERMNMNLVLCVLILAKNLELLPEMKHSESKFNISSILLEFFILLNSLFF